MAVETSTEQFEALEKQANIILAFLGNQGFKRMAPNIVQPASYFLDHMGESLRARTFVFRDKDGDEFCLRPDLTMPICRHYLENIQNDGDADIAARYCYNGQAFRYQPRNTSDNQSREFWQAGAERFGDNDREKADAESLATAIEVVEKAGLNNYEIRLGDLGMFDAVLQAIPMPTHWRTSLRHHFWRPESFHSVLQRLAGNRNQEIQDIRRKLLLKLDPEQPENAIETVEQFLNDNDIPLIGARSLVEITNRLLEQAADLQEKPLSPEIVQTITDYLDVEAKPMVALTRIRDIMERLDLDISVAMASFERRLDILKELGVDPSKTVFSSEFGRNLEYYTGFVFQIQLPQEKNDPEQENGHAETVRTSKSGQIAGGGRYDSLMTSLGSRVEIPAVGFAINTERLLNAVVKEEA